MTEADRPAADSSATADSGREAWERLLPLWHLVVGSGLVLTTLTAAIQGDLVGSRLIVTVALVALLGVGYTLVFVRRTPGDLGEARSLAYLIAVGVVYFGLLRQSPAYFWLQPVLFSQIFFLVRIRWALLIVAYYIVITVQSQLELAGESIQAAFPGIIGPMIAIGYFVILSTWIGKIIEQSGERQALIDRIDATRQELAERERQTGILEERERMSRELHDTLAQDLVGVVTHLQAADAAADSSTATRHRAEAARMAHEGLAETRRLVWALRPAALEDATLVESLERTIDRWRQTNGVHATLLVIGELQALHPDVEITLLRSAQEGLANVARHAGAREVTVTLSYLGDVVTLDVHDNGFGFEPVVPVDTLADAAAAGGHSPTPSPGLGLGLRGMRERAELLGGSVAIESSPGDGTTVGVTLPVARATT